MMTASSKNYMDEMMVDDMICGDLFDQIDDLIDLSNEDVMGMLELSNQISSTPTTTNTPTTLPPLPPNDAFFVGGCDLPADNAGNITAAKDDKLATCDEIDIAELEWLSTFFEEDTFSPTPIDFPNNNHNHSISISSDNTTSKEDSLFRTSSPVSVLEPSSHGGGSSSSSSSSSEGGGGGSSSSSTRKTVAPLSPREIVVTVPGRARSKRPRPATFSPRPHVLLPILPPSSIPIDAPTLIPPTPPSSVTESFGESNPPQFNLPNHHFLAAPIMMKKKKKKMKMKNPSTTAFGDDEEGSPAVLVRKCMHCEIQKTPQWRAGPMGPKTLCNACGVRYKSGRLFPEYRPAASPTFVPALHSNSHKKVVEMRIKATEPGTAGMLPSEDVASKNCDLLNYIRRGE